MNALTLSETDFPFSPRRARLRALPKHRDPLGGFPLPMTCARAQTTDAIGTEGCAPAQCAAERARVCSDREPVALHEFDLTFFVSRDGEFVRLELTGEETSIDFGGRVHHRTLLTLAQRRLADRAQGLPETSCGWVYADDLHRDAGIDALLVNLHVFRARKTLAAKGIVGAEAIVERRGSTHEIRIGSGRLTIVTL